MAAVSDPAMVTATIWSQISPSVIGSPVTLSHRPGPDGVDVGGAALLGDDSGLLGQITFGFRHAYRSYYELWGSEGRLLGGVPQVLAPRDFDTPVRAARLAELGAAVTVDFDTITGAVVRDAVCRVLDDKSFQDSALRLRQQVLAEPSPAEVVTLLTRSIGGTQQREGRRVAGPGHVPGPAGSVRSRETPGAGRRG